MHQEPLDFGKFSLHSSSNCHICRSWSRWWRASASNDVGGPIGAITEKYEKEMEEARTKPSRPTGFRAIMPRFGEHAFVLAVDMLDGRTQASVVPDEGQFNLSLSQIQKWELMDSMEVSRWMKVPQEEWRYEYRPCANHNEILSLTRLRGTSLRNSILFFSTTTWFPHCSVYCETAGL